MAIKIALGQVGASSEKPVIDDDACDSAFFDMGFEMGYDGGMREIVAVLQGIAAGIDQLREDNPANDNQGRLDLE